MSRVMSLDQTEHNYSGVSSKEGLTNCPTMMTFTLCESINCRMYSPNTDNVCVNSANCAN